MWINYDLHYKYWLFWTVFTLYLLEVRWIDRIFSSITIHPHSINSTQLEPQNSSVPKTRNGERLRFLSDWWVSMVSEPHVTQSKCPTGDAIGPPSAVTGNWASSRTNLFVGSDSLVSLGRLRSHKRERKLYCYSRGTIVIHEWEQKTFRCVYVNVIFPNSLLTIDKFTFCTKVTPRQHQ